LTAPVSFLIAVTVTFISIWPLRRLAITYRILDRPASGAHKSHRRPIPYLGGVAIFFGVAASLLLHPDPLLGLLALIGLVMALGLYDDVFHASVPTKLAGEAAIAVAAMALGFTWHITDSAPLNLAVTLVWIVGITNSFNLLDNMDGLSSTIGATCLLGLALISLATTPLAIPMAGALIGFLYVNRPPARMYMGDCGSLQVGFTAALATISATNNARGLHSLVLLAAPVAPALLDTSLVIVSRLLTGRPVQLGGRDHVSHRLQVLGWGRPLVLLAAFIATAAGVAIAGLAGLYPLALAWLALPLVIAYGGVWLRLLRVDPYTARVQSKPEVISA
jgi:UDP-N-acetylmuramyl pentapeptide phosphotransferase/UDP-N-acetylglucosamine-1-phosphate transferase